jgi:hypothetical protein
MAVTSTFEYRRPKWGRGMITLEDAQFLHDAVLDLRPQVIVELGVASGCSSTVLLAAMEAVHGRGGGDPWLYSFDVLDRCYFDTSRPTGAAVAEMVPHLAPKWRFTVGDGLRARGVVPPGIAQLAFIDANHLHPHASLDLLAILPTLAPEAHVILHDIRLPMLGVAKSTGHGPMHLFKAWPGPTRQGGGNNNVGMGRLPADRQILELAVRSALKKPWESEPGAEYFTALGVGRPHRGPTAEEKERRRLQILARRAAERPIYVWGAGRAGQRTLATLKKKGIRVDGFIDRDPGRCGGAVQGITVRPPSHLDPDVMPRPFVVVASMYSGEISSALEAAGWAAYHDYAVM